MSILVCYHLCNNVPQTRWLRRSESEIQVSAGHAVSEGSRGGSFRPLPASGAASHPWCSLADRCITLISAAIFTWPSPDSVASHCLSSVYVCVFLSDTRQISTHSDDLIFTRLYLQRPYFHMLHSQALRVRTSDLMGEHKSTHNSYLTSLCLDYSFIV